jgi:hypothetical protein
MRTMKDSHWSMKHDLELIGLSKLSLPLETIAARFGRDPDNISRKANRLGLALKRGRSVARKAKGK